jgi:hypothetical protein
MILEWRSIEFKIINILSLIYFYLEYLILMEHSGIAVANSNNVLFEPPIYAQNEEEFDEHMAESQSVTTEGGQGKMDIDPSLLTAQRMYEIDIIGIITFH